MLSPLALAALLTGAAHAQSPHDAWRTLDTGHFRVHYPAEAEAWVLQAASRFEAIHAGVVQAVGYDPERAVDIVVMDPYAMANGFALPLLASPRMGVFPSPPGAGSSLAHYHDWADDLVTHEDVHLVHMTMPSRNPLGAFYTRALFGVGPIALKTPVWAIEGYATMLEGQLTGAGRPHGSDRAAFLRSLAQAGRLPSYAELNGTQAWRGGSVPYLVGSAFFEWLVARQGAQSARDLWARLSAREIRFFAAAFEGVYGAPPDELYARFCAELTHRALSIEDQRPATPATLWQELLGSTGAPAVAPDGSKLAVVEETQTKGRRILVLDTAEDDQALQDWQEGVARTLERDPADAAPVQPTIFPHQRLAQWQSGGRRPVDPRWTPGGGALLFTSWVRQPSGDLSPELFLWDTEQGGARRITRGGGVQDADPHPAGGWAVAVQQRWGSARLVRVELDSGEILGLTAMELDAVHDQPRFDPSGAQLAWLRHRGRWQVVLMELSTGAERVLALPSDAEPLHLAWAPEGDALISSMSVGGFVELYRLPLSGGPPTRLTQSTTAALAPSPGQAGVYYLAPDSLGLQLHFLPSEAPPPSDLLVDAMAPAVPLAPAGEPTSPETTPLAQQPRDYELGRAEWRPLISGSSWRGGGTTQPGLRVGDVVGRWEALAQVAMASGTAPGGATLAAAWRGWPVELQGQIFGVGELTTRRAGAAVDAGLVRYGDGSWGRLQAGLWTDVGWGEDPEHYRAAGFASLAGGKRLWLGPAWIDGAAQLDGQHGTTRGATWQLGTGQAELGLGVGAVGLLGSYSRSATTGAGALDRLRLGGSHVALMPEAWQASRMAMATVEAGAAYGSDHDAWRGALDIDRSLTVFLERHRIWDRATGLEPVGATALALELSTGAPSNPLARLPGLDLRVGIGCVLEHPDQGWRTKPCADKDHWSGWLGGQWEL